MDNSPKYLVAYDGSPHSKAALDWAIALAGQTGAEIEVAKVFEPIIRHYTSSDYNISTQIVEQLAEMEKADHQMMEDINTFKADSCSVKIRTKILKGQVAAALLDYASQNGVSLVIAGTKGHHLLEKLLVGSVTSSLVALSKVPVMIVTDQRETACPKKLLVAYDGSEQAKKALALAVDLGKRIGAEILVAKVIDPVDLAMIYSNIEPGSEVKINSGLIGLDKADKAILEEAESVGSASGVKVATTILTGDNIADTIIRYAEEQEVDIIVAGTLGKGLLSELMVGSVAKNLVTLAQMPVLVAK